MKYNLWNEVFYKKFILLFILLLSTISVNAPSGVSGSNKTSTNEKNNGINAYGGTIQIKSIIWYKN